MVNKIDYSIVFLKHFAYPLLTTQFILRKSNQTRANTGRKNIYVEKEHSMFTRRNFIKIGGLSLSTFGFAADIFARSDKNAQTQLRDLTVGVESLNEHDYRARIESAAIDQPFS